MDIKDMLKNSRAQGGLDILTKCRINHSLRSSEFLLQS